MARAVGCAHGRRLWHTLCLEGQLPVAHGQLTVAQGQGKSQNKGQGQGQNKGKKSVVNRGDHDVQI